MKRRALVAVLGKGTVLTVLPAAALQPVPREPEKLPANTLTPSLDLRPFVPIDLLPMQVVELVWSEQKSGWVNKSRRQVNLRWVAVGSSGVRKWIVVR